jgi:hypothetical protein
MGAPQLNIKDAELTGESQTEAVRKALRERLDREKAEREAHDARTEADKRREFEGVWAKITKIQDRVRKRRLGENFLTEEDLYDENGLPK